MKAAVVERFGTLPAVRDVPEPEPDAGQVLVRTRASGVCRTDLKVIGGAIPTVPTPIIPGHELAGEVAALGDGVVGHRVGDRVLASLDVTCGVCAYCRTGQRDYCISLRRLGMEIDGSLAEYVVVPAANLLRVPDGVPYEEAATIPDAVGSPYHAVVRRAGVRPGQVVAVYGLGGLGLTAVQVAAIAGARVIGIARTPERRQLAEELGATWTVDPSGTDVVDAVRELTDGLGVHAFLDIVGTDESVDQAVRASRKGGRVVVVGYLVPQLRATMMRLVYDEISILGSRGSTRGDLEEAVDLVGRRVLRPVIGATFTLDRLDAALARLEDGSVIGRAVINEF